MTLNSPIHLEQALLVAAPLGILVGFASAALCRSDVQLRRCISEHICGRLHVHWLWYRRSAESASGVGGFFFQGLGVGYDNIAEVLRGNAPVALLLGPIVAKSLMWPFSLSSGTSGGVLAPILMIGAALGEGVARLANMPGETQALWALMAMGAMLAGALGVPLTAILFSLELTHALPALLPLALACTASYLVTSLVMPRSILTEKLSRRGHHLSREYGVDPLEMISVAEVMRELSVELETEVVNRTSYPKRLRMQMRLVGPSPRKWQ